MPYATATDLGLTDDLLVWLTSAEDLGVPDAGKIDKALTDASNRIDRHIAQRYSLPWSDTEGQLRDLAVALARYQLYTLRPDGPELPKVIVDAKLDAERDLRDLRDGRLSLAGASLAEANPTEPAKIRVRGPSRTFSRDTMDQW
jgi:phage gp36-like protein